MSLVEGPKRAIVGAYTRMALKDVFEEYHDVEFMFNSFAQDNSSSYFFFGDLVQNIVYISETMRDDLGLESNVIEDGLERWKSYISSEYFVKMYEEDFADIYRNKREVHDLRYQIKNKYGEDIWIRCYALIKWSDDKETPLFISGRITHQDETFVVDTLTNFPRERTAIRRLIAMEDCDFTVVAFSLNHITELNNTKGRDYADFIISNISRTLSKTITRDGSIAIYKMEGVRFLLLIDNSIATMSVDEVIGQVKSIVVKEYLGADLSFDTSCSFGVIDYPSEFFGVEELIENLISLIRTARANPSKPYIKYDTETSQNIKDKARMTMHINKCVGNGMKNFRPVVQPIVSSESGAIIGGEVLMRWQNEGKDVSPGVFIPILEDGHLIHIAGRWIFEQTVRICSQVVKKIPEFYLTFNVSLQQLLDDGFVDFMQSTLEKYNIDGSHIVAELTESCLDEHPEKLDSFIKSAQEMRVRIALDDFGTGYSSFRMLLQYSYDIIKLDRSLLTEMMESDDKKKFIESIVFSCHQFGKKVCIEGVEEKLQDDMVKQAGCDIIQGFYYFRPLEVEKLYEHLNLS